MLANEEVIDGVSERGGHPVIRKVYRFVFYFFQNLFFWVVFLLYFFEWFHNLYSVVVYYQAANEAMDAEDYCIC